jgi:two-component system, sensor histidine kinase YesM
MIDWLSLQRNHPELMQLYLIKRIESFFHTLFTKLSIFQKLLASFSFIIILPLSISYGVSHIVIEKSVVERIQDSGYGTFTIVKQNLDDLLERMSSAALFIDGSVELGEILNNPPSTPVEKYRTADYVEGLFNDIENTIIREDSFLSLLIDDGQLYTNHYQHQNLKNEITQILEKNLQRQNVGLNWIKTDSILQLYDTQDKYTFSLSKHITISPARRNTAFLLITISKSVLEEQLLEPTPAFFLIVDQDNRLAGKSPNKEVKQTYGEPIDLSHADSRGIRTVSYNESRYFLFEEPLTIGIWKLLYMIPREYVLGEIRAVSLQLLLVNIISISVFLLFALWISRSISVPIVQLSDQMGDIKRILHSKQNLRSERTDEIGILESSFVQMQANIKRLMQENIQKERRKREAELEALQAQISPHFLFNTLNTIRWASFNGNTEKVSNVVLSLGKLLRMTITRSEDLISLEEELELIEHYLSIIQSRHSVDFEYHIDIDESIRKARIPKLLLQPIAENAVLHGLSDTDYKGSITIIGEKQGNEVHLEVQDNGKGFIPNEEEPQGSAKVKTIRFSHIGIANIEERIRLFYGEKYGLSLQSRPGQGTTVTIRIPFSTKGGLDDQTPSD